MLLSVQKGYTPISFAVLRNSPVAVVALLRAGANTIYKVHKCVFDGKSIDILILGHVVVRTQQNGNQSCLYVTSLFSGPKVTEALLEGGIVLCEHEQVHFIGVWRNGQW